MRVHQNNTTRLHNTPGRANQDRGNIQALPAFSHTSHSMEKLLRKATQDAQAEIVQQHYSEEGSTLSSAIVTPTATYLNILGDSPIVIYALKDGVWKHAHQSVAHDGDNPKEAQRLKENRTPFWFGRVSGVLAVSRALGDQPYESGGLSHEPDFESVDLQAYDDFAVIVVSDGADYLFPPHTQDHRIVENYLNSTPLNKDQLASFIVEKGRETYPSPRKDDVVATIVFKQDVSTETYVQATVCDGHAGPPCDNETIHTADIGIHAFTQSCRQQLGLATEIISAPVTNLTMQSFSISAPQPEIRNNISVLLQTYQSYLNTEIAKYIAAETCDQRTALKQKQKQVTALLEKLNSGCPLGDFAIDFNGVYNDQTNILNQHRHPIEIRIFTVIKELLINFVTGNWSKMSLWQPPKSQTMLNDIAEHLSPVQLASG